MGNPIFDYEDGDFIIQTSDNMGIDTDGNTHMRLGDNMSLDVDMGEVHLNSGWSNNEDENSGMF